MPQLALMTVHGRNGPPSIEDAAQELGIGIDDIDQEFGVVLVDPKAGLYSVQVDAARLPEGGESGSAYRGPFSNPRIEPFGPPKESKK